MANDSYNQEQYNNSNFKNKGEMNKNAMYSSPSFNTSQNYYRNNQNGHPIKNRIKRTVIKEGIKKGAQAYGIPEMATEQILESSTGKEILDAASNAQTPTEGAKEIVKVVAKKQVINMLPAVILPLLLILIVLGLFMGKLAVSGLGSDNGNSYDELKAEIKRVSRKYSSRAKIDENLIFATLVSYKADEEYIGSGETMKNMSYMKKQVEKLALFQIMTTKQCSYDSSTIRKIAQNDDLFKEANYKCVEDVNGDGIVDEYDEKTVIYTLSNVRGNYNDDNSGSTYFWNLIDEEFIFNYYNEYMFNQNSNTIENVDKINEIIDYIYSFYELMDNSNFSNKPLCSDGITVDGVTMDLEDYVKGVLYSEVGNNDVPSEALKAMAVATRSNLLSASNSCTREMHSSTSNMNYASGYESNNSLIESVDYTSGQYLVHDDQIFSATYTSFPDFGSGCNVVCDNNYCTADLSYDYGGKLGTHSVKVPRYVNGIDVANDGIGSCSGMSKYAIINDANSGATYSEILGKHYSNAVETIHPAIGGLVNEDGFLKRVSRANRENLYYYSTNTEHSNGYIAGGLEGECAWYAVKRTNEIIATMGLDNIYDYVYGGGDGRDFCYASDYQQFEKSTNPNDPTLKAGAIISWYDNAYGHVAVVEAVYRDKNGNITSIDVSEASIGFGQYGRNARTIINNSLNSTLKRKENCEGNGTGCQNFKNISMNDIKNLYGQQKFICYIKIVK